MARKRKKKKYFSAILAFIFLFLILGVSLYGVYEVINLDKKSYFRKKTRPILYEEKRSSLEERIKKVDLAILESTDKARIPLRNIKYKSVNLRKHHNNLYHYQQIHLFLSQTKKKVFLNKFVPIVSKSMPWVSLSLDRDVLKIKIDGVLTHSLIFIENPFIPSIVRGKIFFVIDDMGDSIYKAKRLYEILGNRVVFSILPYAIHSKEVVLFAKRRNIKVMLHLPMEPVGYPNVDPGRGALYVNMKPREIRNTFLKDLARVPGAIGVNNHMGSRFTTYEQGMKVLLTTIANKGLFFLDSLTTPKSVTLKVASRIRNLKVYYRDIFLDNQKNESYILLQIKKAQDLTKNKKKVIAIGHPYEETLFALAKWIKTTKYSKLAMGKF